MEHVNRRSESVSRIAAMGLVVSVALASTGCGPGGGCFYRDTPGTARITAVQASTSGSVCPNGGVEVLFDFTPSDAAKTDLAATGQRLTVGGGSDPARSWVDASGLSVGSVHPATRKDETNGACSPRVFILTDLDYTAGANACYGT